MDMDFSMSEMIFQIDKLTGSSPGPDGIHNSMLKQLPFYVKRKLLEAYNTIWKNGNFPELWRTSILVPIPKPPMTVTEEDSTALLDWEETTYRINL